MHCEIVCKHFIMDSFSIPSEDDFYAILGCSEQSTAEQISTEYRIKMLKYHPDKVSGSSAEEKTYHHLQRAKEVLLDEEMRAKYDTWRMSGVIVPWDQWLALQERAHLSMHWAPKPTTRPAIQDSTVDQQGTSSNDDQGYNHACKMTGSTGHLSEFRTQYFSSKSTKSLSKFRNYQD